MTKSDEAIDGDCSHRSHKWQRLRHPMMQGTGALEAVEDDAWEAEVVKQGQLQLRRQRHVVVSQLHECVRRQTVEQCVVEVGHQRCEFGVVLGE